MSRPTADADLARLGKARVAWGEVTHPGLREEGLGWEAAHLGGKPREQDGTMDPARKAGSWAVIWTTGWLLLLSLLLPEGESVARRGRRGHSGSSKEESAPPTPPPHQHPTLLGPQENQAEFPVLYNSSH